VHLLHPQCFPGSNPFFFSFFDWEIFKSIFFFAVRPQLILTLYDKIPLIVKSERGLATPVIYSKFMEKRIINTRLGHSEDQDV